MVRTYVKKGNHGGARADAGVKAGTELGFALWALTLNNVTWSKRETAEWLLASDLVRDICVAQEKYDDTEVDCDTGEVIVAEEIRYHHHVFMHCHEKIFTADMHELIVMLTEDLGFDLQGCRSRDHWLKYISKVDWCPYMKGVKYTELCLYAKTKQFACREYNTIKTVKPTDPFFVNAGNFKRVCQEVCEDHVQGLMMKEKKAKVHHAANLECKCVTDIVYTYRNNDNMYIYGDAGVGKTELIEGLIKDRVVFRPGNLNKFMFGSMPLDVEVILFEDWSWPLEKKDDPDNMFYRLLSIMDHKPVCIEKKGKDTIEIYVPRVQCIFLSNERIPAMKDMFERRCRCFNIPYKHKLYECNCCRGCE